MLKKIAGGAMPTPDSISSDIITAATFLAGSILVYLGNLNSGFAAFGREEQGYVRRGFRRRAWVALSAFVTSVLTVAAALASAWFDSSCLMVMSAALLAVAFLGGIASAFMLVAELG